MKNSTLITAVLVFSFTAAMLTFSLVLFSQSMPPNPLEMARKQTKMMEKRLNLTHAQLINVSDINEKYALLMADVFKDNTLSREESAEKIKELRDGKDKELNRVLTDEQYETWLIVKKEMRRRVRRE